jgi:hypothetical protein
MVATIRLDPIWGQLFPAEQHCIVRVLIGDRLAVDIEVRLRQTGIADLDLEQHPAEPEGVAA